MAVLLVATGICAYHNSLQGPFIFDDGPSIPENPHLHHLWPIGDALSAPPYSTVNGRPVVCLTLALNYALGKSDVWGYHAFNLAIHLASALVLFGILRRTFAGEILGDRFGTGSVRLAAAIALIWVVHPLQTESVTYVVQRTELLMGLFLLLTLYCTLRGSESARSSTWYLAAVVACALGMGSKEVMVVAPLIVLLYDRVFLTSSFRELWRRRGALYIALAATWLVLAGLVANTAHSRTGFGINGLTSWDYLKTEAGVIVYYVRLGFWPRPLVIDYDDWSIAYSPNDYLVPGVLVLGLLGATLWAFRRRPCLAFLGAWFFLILAPTSSFLPNVGEVAAERRMYLPVAALITLIVVGAVALGKRLFHGRQGPTLGYAALGSVVVLFTFLTIQRNQDYQSELAIWQDTAVKRPSNPRAHDNLGIVLARLGRVTEAIAHHEQSLRLDPNVAGPHYNLANTLWQAGNTEKAIGQYHEALRLNPGDIKALTKLGNVLQLMGRTQDAIDLYEQALRIKPDYAEAHNNLGAALVDRGSLERGIAHYEQALRINPDFAEAHSNLALALEREGRTREAIRHLEDALRLKPDLTEARNTLARLRGNP